MYSSPTSLSHQRSPDVGEEGASVEIETLEPPPEPEAVTVTIPADSADTERLFPKLIVPIPVPIEAPLSRTVIPLVPPPPPEGRLVRPEPSP
jgi:hypothetical protein